MKLPLSISPNAIAEAAVAIYFDTTVPEDVIPGLIYHALKADFPRLVALPLASLPREARTKDSQLMFQPLHQLQGENLSLKVGPRSLMMSSSGDYPGWQTLVTRFRDTLTRVVNAGIIGKPSRFGLRYISFFEKDIFPNLTLSIAIGGEPVNGEGTHFKTVLTDENCRLMLQVSKDVMLIRQAPGPAQRGSVIDIDTFVTNPKITDGLGEAMTEFLERAHTAQKTLFFRLLQPEFLTSLSPVYAVD